MYEMYPDAWPSTLDQRAASIPADKPRRRVRRAHSVTPAPLAHGEHGDLAHEDDRSA